MGDDRGDVRGDDRGDAQAERLFEMARTGSDQLGAEIDAGAPVDLTDGDGNSLLMIAAYNGQEPAVRQLLERGAAVDLVNSKGQSPLAGVAFKGYERIAEALLKAGADPLAGNPSPLQTAEMFSQTALVNSFNDHVRAASEG